MSQQSSSKRNAPKSDSDKDRRQKKALRMESEVDQRVESKVESIEGLMTSFPKEKAISNEQLEKLFHALCGDTGKEYDSDDSIISEIDFMPAEVVAAKDKRVKDAFESLSKMDDEIKTVEKVLNMGKKESKRARDARRKEMRERKLGLTTDEEKKEAEKKRRGTLKRVDKHLDQKIQCFTEAENWYGHFMTCRTFASLLETLAEVVSEEDDPERNHIRIIKKIDAKEFAKQIKLVGINDSFVRHHESIENFTLAKVKLILSDHNALNVLNGTKLFGFDFTTKECLLVLERYFELHMPQYDNGFSKEPLGIDLRALVKAAFNIAREQNKDFAPNEILQHVLFD